MQLALEAAHRAGEMGEVPVGAVLTHLSGEVIALAGNRTISDNNPAGHAEMNVLREAGQKLGNYRLLDTTLFVTLEPCAMCAGAISHARIAKVVIAAEDSKGGAVWHGPRFFEQPTCHWRPEVEQGPFRDEASLLLKEFFRKRRNKTS